MADSVPTFAIAQAIGLTTSAFLAGANISISYMCIPSFQLAPDPLSARQWRAVFNKGKALAPPFTMVSAAMFGYLAYKFYDVPLSTIITRGQLYALAMVAAISIIPYTLIVMRTVNEKLHAKCADLEVLDVKENATQISLPKRETTAELLNTWKFHNIIRGLLCLSAAVLGMLAALA